MAYDEKSIKILEGLEAVRKRPGMYIGSTDKRGLHHLIWEIVDNAIDEVINGYGDTITVTIHKDQSLSVRDNGRGVPVGMHESGKSAAEVIYTVLHAGGKFSSEGYKVSGGLHGVGASVVNALSKWMKVTIERDGGIYEISFKNGGHTDKKLTKIGTSKKTGTCVRFMPDDEIFETTNFSYTTICERMQESAFLISNLTIHVIDEEDEKESVFHYENGIVSFVEYINENKNPINKQVIDIRGEKNGIIVSVAMQYTDSYNENILSFVNNVKTIDGGSHEVGFKTALTKVFNDYAKENGIFKGNGVFDGKDVREGLSAVISLKIPEGILEFEGQTKGKLGTPQAKSVVESLVYEKLNFYLLENKETATKIVEKSLKSKLAREAARKARDEARKGTNKKTIEKNLSAKLVPAHSKNPKVNELFLVEGDSALGSAKQSRNPKTQAILPLRGKVLNAERSTSADIYKNEELNTIIHTIGAGVGAEFDAADSNYDKVIILTDADDDGAHIQVLLIAFFYRYMRPLIEAGKLYIALPPLFMVEERGKKRTYFWSNEELKDYIKGKTSYEVKRFKGLGEMDPDQLEETTMNAEKRTLIRINITDALLAEKRVNVLMGDAVEPRKEWINENIDFTLEDDFKIKGE